MTKASKGRLNGGGTAQHGDLVVSPNTSHNTLVIKSVFITLSKCWIKCCIWVLFSTCVLFVVCAKAICSQYLY